MMSLLIINGDVFLVNDGFEIGDSLLNGGTFIVIAGYDAPLFLQIFLELSNKISRICVTGDNRIYVTCGLIDQAVSCFSQVLRVADAHLIFVSKMLLLDSLDLGLMNGLGLFLSWFILCSAMSPF